MPSNDKTTHFFLTRKSRDIHNKNDINVKITSFPNHRSSYHHTWSAHSLQTFGRNSVVGARRQKAKKKENFGKVVKKRRKARKRKISRDSTAPNLITALSERQRSWRPIIQTSLRNLEVEGPETWSHSKSSKSAIFADLAIKEYLSELSRFWRSPANFHRFLLSLRILTNCDSSLSSSLMSRV